MKIYLKLITGFMIVSFLVGLVGFIGLYVNQQIVTAFESGEEHFGAIITASAEVSSYAKRAEGHIMLFLTLNDPADIEKFSNRMESLRNYTSIIDEKTHNPEARKILEDIKIKTNKLQSVGESLIEAHYNGTKPTGRFDFDKHEEEIRNLNKFASEIREDGVSLAKLETQLKAENEKTAKKSAEALYNIIFLISIISVIIAITIGYFIAKNISRPIEQIKKVTDDVSGGNLKTRIRIKSKDETGELASSFNEMIDNLEKSKEKMEDYNKQLEKDVVDRTKEINKAKVILEDYNGQLEKDVADRTKELSSKVDELERLNNLGVGRELKMLELKERIKELESLLKEHEIKT